MVFLLHLGLQNPFLKLKPLVAPVEKRVFYPKDTKQVLESVYNTYPHPNSSYLKKLSEDLNIEPIKLFQWFRRRRTKEKLRGKIL